MKNPRNITYFTAFLAILAVNIWFRLYPAFLPVFDKQAEFITRKGLDQRVERGEISSYSQGDINSYARAVADDLKSNYRDNNGQTYLLEFDPHGWALATKQTIEHGFPGTRLKDGKPWDDFSLAPEGKGVNDNQLFFYTSAFLYKAWGSLFGQIGLNRFLFYLPLFYALIFLIFIFFVCRYFFGALCGLMAMFFVGLGPLILQRSCAGWFDTDLFTIFFPLLVIFFLTGACDKNQTLYRRFFYAALGLIGLFLFSYAWVGWWYCWAFCGGAIFIIICLDVFSKAGLKRMPVIGAISALVAFLLFGLALYIWRFGIKDIRWIGYGYGYDYWINIKNASNFSVWPNTLTTVVEFARPAMNAFDTLLPGRFLTMAACFCPFIGLYYVRSRFSRNFIIFLFVWFLAGFFMACQAVRFIVFAWVPAGIFLALFLSEAVRYLLNRIKTQGLFVRKVLFGVAAVFLLSIPAVVFVVHAHNAMKKVVPSINRDWVLALEYIRDNTPKQAIINSWWDHGDWFKYIAQRRTIVDGQTFMWPVTYWMGRAMLSADENEVMNILRMLNNSSDKLFYEISPSFPDDFACIAFMDKLVKSDKMAAKKLFTQYNLPENVRKRIVDSIFTSPSVPAYIVIDESMLGKMPSISAVGGWDFARFYISRHLKDSDDLLAAHCNALFGISRAEVIEKKRALNKLKDDRLSQFSKESVFSKYFVQGEVSGDTLNFFNLVKLDLSNKIAVTSLFGNSSRSIENVFIFNGKELLYNHDTGSDVVPETAFFINTPARCQAIFAKEPRVVSSLFSRLFFMGGYGLKHFKMFKDGTQDGIFVYEIIWD